MTGEQTKLSEVLTPVIEEYSIVDILLFAGLALTVAGVILSAVNPLYGLGLVFGTLIANSVWNNKDNIDYSVSKNGTHIESVNESETICDECTDKTVERVGYKVTYLFGYELFRKEQFRNSVCDECTLEIADSERENIQELEQAEKQKVTLER